jgi:hypothetical protein
MTDWGAMFRSVEIRDPDRRCRHCKYSLDGLGGGGGLKCPECGNIISDDDLLGVRRFCGPGKEVLWACAVPLVGAGVTAFAAVLSLALDQDWWMVSASMVCAMASIFVAVLSIVIVAIVYVVRANRAPVACRLLITNRCLAVMLGHIVVALAMVAWVWRCMTAYANV